jgi:hypothetical protein
VKQRKVVTVNDKMQRGYRYQLTEPIGRNFAAGFRPELTPAQMLQLGVFGGKYMTDCAKEFPHSWFVRAKLADKTRDRALNCFGADCLMPPNGTGLSKFESRRRIDGSVAAAHTELGKPGGWS